jgi:hypothetical protein
MIMAKRMTILSTDVMLINGKSLSTALRKIDAVRKSLKKQKGAEITIKEFCEHHGYDYNETVKFLGLE